MAMIEHDGQPRTITELSRMCGLSRTGLRMRYAQGKRGEDLVRQPTKGKGRAQTVDYRGRKVTLRELSLQTGINLHTLKWRASRGVRGTDLVKKPRMRVIR